MLHDPAFEVLMRYLNDCSGRTIWVADENALAVIASVTPDDDLAVVSNRYDACLSANKSGIAAEFSDFDFSSYPDGSIQRIVYRISKEKPIVHHVLNQACRLLSDNGELIISGFKDEGIKTYTQKCRALFEQVSAEKNGSVYIGIFSKALVPLRAGGLDDRNYPTLRLINTPSLNFYSKPGLFGWDRIDAGSALLVDHLPAVLECQLSTSSSLLDLGCGYGYLTLATACYPFMRRVATDNNAAAIAAMKCNANFYGLDVAVIAGDAGKDIDELFDVILCNPPFHQGFDVSDELTDKFLISVRNLLARSGLAVFVVNAFVGLEKKAGLHFSSVSVIARNASFKLVLLRR